MCKFCNRDYHCCCVNVSYVVGHERASSLLFRCAMSVCSVNINILMWICEAEYTTQEVVGRTNRLL
jgi:hypothetical protein